MCGALTTQLQNLFPFVAVDKNFRRLRRLSALFVACCGIAQPRKSVLAWVGDGVLVDCRNRATVQPSFHNNLPMIISGAFYYHQSYLTTTGLMQFRGCARFVKAKNQTTVKNNATKQMGLGLDKFWLGLCGRFHWNRVSGSNAALLFQMAACCRYKTSKEHRLQSYSE